MKRIVITFGLISGAIVSAMMLVTLPFMERIGYDKGEVIGYTTMVLSFLLVCFGIRSYRENVGGGRISFGRAFSVGILITLISCACYVATWEVIYYRMVPDFWDKYGAFAMEKAKASGATQPALDKQLAELKRYREMYRNPFVNVAMTFMEPFPVGLVITLACAGVMSRKRPALQRAVRPGVPLAGP